MHTRELQPIIFVFFPWWIAHNSCTRANCNVNAGQDENAPPFHNSHTRANCNCKGLLVPFDFIFTIHIHVRIATIWIDFKILCVLFFAIHIHVRIATCTFDNIMEFNTFTIHIHVRIATFTSNSKPYRNMFTIHIHVRIATATYCVSNFNSRICSNSISNIYFVLPILRHILPISYTSLARTFQHF